MYVITQEQSSAMSSFKSRDNRLHVRARRSLKNSFRRDLFESRKYWEDRYHQGGNSGAGSYGRLGQFKANVLNAFVSEWDIRSVIEWGCGDGHQLSLADYPEYLGIDISEKAVEICRKKETLIKTREKNSFNPRFWGSNG